MLLCCVCVSIFPALRATLLCLFPAVSYGHATAGGGGGGGGLAANEREHAAVAEVGKDAAPATAGGGATVTPQQSNVVTANVVAAAAANTTGPAAAAANTTNETGTGPGDGDGGGVVNVNGELWPSLLLCCVFVSPLSQDSQPSIILLPCVQCYRHKATKALCGCRGERSHQERGGVSPDTPPLSTTLLCLCSFGLATLLCLFPAVSYGHATAGGGGGGGGPDQVAATGGGGGRSQRQLNAAAANGGGAAKSAGQPKPIRQVKGQRDLNGNLLRPTTNATAGRQRRAGNKPENAGASGQARMPTQAADNAGASQANNKRKLPP
jgi:hypothetical protein